MKSLKAIRTPHVNWVILIFMLMTPVAVLGQRPCPSLAMTGDRARLGSSWSLAAVQNEMQRPVHRESLILVTAHRGGWDYCPENTIEGAMVAMDDKLEVIELDVRVSKDGSSFLTHDWDLRGEALNKELSSPTENNIYKLDAQSSKLNLRFKPDRYGQKGYTGSGTTKRAIFFQSFREFLDHYLARIKLIPNGIAQNGVVQRGAVIVLDIKGEDRVVSQLEYDESLQLRQLLAILKEVRTFELAEKVDLRHALIYKVNLKAMKVARTEPPAPVAAANFAQKVRDEGLLYLPSLIFIIYPEDWNRYGEVKTRERYEPWLQDYRQNYDRLIAVDWQTRFPGINLENESMKDVRENRGVGAFVSYNPFPEGMRRSDGTCTFQEWVNPNLGSICLQQGLKQYASAALEFFFPPPGGKEQLLATSITTDMYENAVNYLTVTGRRDTKWIAWGAQTPVAAPENERVIPPASETSVGAPGIMVMDLVVDTSACKKGPFDRMTGRCVEIADMTLQNNSFYLSGSRPRVAEILKIGAEDFAKGLTVAIEMPSARLNPTTIENVLTITDSYQRPAVSVLRGPQGAWYVGKQIDRIFDQSFATKLWDPVSPCAKRKCLKETVYLSFRSTGELRIDDFAILDQPNGDQIADWQATLMNYGMPVYDYQEGSTSPVLGDDWPNWPTRNPSFVPAGGLSMAILDKEHFGVKSKYRNVETNFLSARATRLTVWTGGILGGETAPKFPGLARTLEEAILLEQKANFTRSGKQFRFDTKWVACNSGQYQVNRTGETLNGPATQYSPSGIGTPCNPSGNIVPVSSPPRDPKALIEVEAH
jgi:glycerophosphoryl diester phosphodiesterase